MILPWKTAIIASGEKSAAYEDITLLTPSKQFCGTSVVLRYCTKWGNESTGFNSGLTRGQSCMSWDPPVVLKKLWWLEGSIDLTDAQSSLDVLLALSLKNQMCILELLFDLSLLPQSWQLWPGASFISFSFNIHHGHGYPWGSHFQFGLPQCGLHWPHAGITLVQNATISSYLLECSLRIFFSDIIWSVLPKLHVEQVCSYMCHAQTCTCMHTHTHVHAHSHKLEEFVILLKQEVRFCSCVIVGMGEQYKQPQNDSILSYQ